MLDLELALDLTVGAMTAPDLNQQPLGTGFGGATTTHDVLAGIDLTGTTAIVTGGYSGLGRAATSALAAAGARVIVPARRPELARANLATVPGVEVVAMDLSDLESVRSFARGVVDRGTIIGLVINSAGVMANPLTRVGPGWESQFAINHLGHFALVDLLMPAFDTGGARVVSVSSGAHAISPIRWADIHFTHREYDPWVAYGQSKTANVLFAVQLDSVGRSLGVRAFSVQPGSIITPLQRHIPRDQQIEMGWIDGDGVPSPEFKTPAQGAATAVWAATSPLLEGRGGEYCEDCDIAPLAKEGAPGGVAAWAIVTDSANELWAYSADATRAKVN